MSIKEKNGHDLAYNIDFELAEKEVIAEVENNAPNIKLGRYKAKMVDKMVTPMWKLEDLFISEQRGRNNTENTIKYYKGCFASIYRFLAFHAPTDTEDYKKVLDKYEDEAIFGKMLPIMYLEMDGFEEEYRTYILDVVEASEQTMLSLFRAYRALAYFAMDKGWIESRRIVIRDIEPPIKQTFTNDELDRLLKKPDIDDYTAYRNWVIINYMLATGNRIGSVAALKVKDVDLQEGYANVNVIKNRQPIRINLISKITTILDEYINAYRCDDKIGEPLWDEALFPNTYGQTTTSIALSKSVASYHLDRRVTKTSCHLYRHTFAKNWILSGGDILTLQKTLGHKSLKMVQRYANLYDTDLKPIVEQHALLNKVKEKSGRQKLTRRK